jgi:hypothetical protein
MAEKFDFEAALKAVQSGQSITGKDGVLGPLVKQLTEAALDSIRTWPKMSPRTARTVNPGRR